MYDWLAFLGISALSVVLLLLFLHQLREFWPRCFLFLFHVSLFVNSGVAQAYADVPLRYAFLHCVFLIVFSLTFVGAWGGLRRFALALRVHGETIAVVCNRPSFVRLVFVIFFASLIFSLLYPEFRLNAVFSLQAPDLRADFAARFEGVRRNGLSALVNYISVLFFPFFLVVLERYRSRAWVLAGLYACVLYLGYVQRQYIARGTVMLAILAVALYYFAYFPYLRRRLLACSALAAIPIVIFLEYWGYARLGSSYEFRGVGAGIEYLALMETSFVRTAGVAVLESGLYADLWEYAKWIVTLPIPKVLTGAIDGARINYEIAEIVLDVPRGSPGFFVLLAGVVAESEYIFGKTLFWVHAMFLGMVSATVIRLSSAVPGFGLLTAWTVIFLAYKIPGAGVGGVLPVIVNNNMLLYVFLAYFLFRRSDIGLRRRHDRASAGYMQMTGEARNG